MDTDLCCWALCVIELALFCAHGPTSPFMTSDGVTESTIIIEGEVGPSALLSGRAS